MTARRALDGAAELLAAVRRRAHVAIVTNNLLEEQQDKLQYCGLAPIVDALIASEDVGVSKPDPEIFRHRAERAPASGADEAVMLGDSWPNDIVGAGAAGIRAVWFNPDRSPSARRHPPDVAEVHRPRPG